MKQVTLAVLLCMSLKFFPQALSTYVNPFVGTGGTGHTFPGAVLPFGMVQLSPDTRADNSWDGCSGYYYPDSLIYGFSHTHLSGTGCSDYGDVMLMPMAGNTGFESKEYRAAFSHKREQASPGYYAVELNNHIKVKLTATNRVGIHQYVFPKGKSANIVMDLTHRDKLIAGNIEVVNDSTIQGYRISEAWAKRQVIYFYIKFSKPFTSKSKIERTVDQHDGGSSYEIVKRAFTFQLKENEALVAKVAISNVSTEGAKKNLLAEAVHWKFDTYKKQATEVWNRELAKIRVATPDKEKKQVFYTALYHTMIHPSLAMDVDSMYRGRDNEVHQAKGFAYYSVFSLWDTFRAENPLFSIIDPKRHADFINTFIAQYQQAGRPPVWELSGYETDCMIGYHSVPVMADAIAKNIQGFDKAQAYAAMLAAASYTGFGSPAFHTNNFLQADDEPESVSKTLEYAYDDWCIAQVAQRMGNQADYARFIKNAQAYKNVFDPSTGFMRPRKNGNWLSPFDPKEVNNHYTEANAWQYSFFVPQDLQGLIGLMGNEGIFEKKLDELFSTSTQTTGRDQVDITGLIGQYAHGNEPSHHMTYLYNYIGKPYKGAERVSQIMTNFYKNAPDGLIGNEDCGQMSAWYVMSAMGFYQVCPGSVDYVMGSPIFDTVKVQVAHGKTFTMIRKGPAGDKHLKYIRSMELAGKSTLRSFINHFMIQNGVTLTVNMTSYADSARLFGKDINDRPTSYINTYPIVTAPVVNAPAGAFTGQAKISFENFDNKTELYYTLDGSVPTRRSTLYKTAFSLDTTTTVRVKAYRYADSSSTVTGRIYKKPNNWSVRINGRVSPQYAAGGNESLIDGIRGDLNWRKGDWQGYQGQDLECIVDLGKAQSIQQLYSGYIQDTRAWIIYPKKVEYYVSSDGINYDLAGTYDNTVKADDYTVQLNTFSVQLAKPASARYIKIKAVHYGKLPEWHMGAGGDAYIFIDEIGVK